MTPRTAGVSESDRRAARQLDSAFKLSFSESLFESRFRDRDSVTSACGRRARGPAARVRRRPGQLHVTSLGSP
jgi:hypothetical protein